MTATQTNVIVTQYRAEFRALPFARPRWTVTGPWEHRDRSNRRRRRWTVEREFLAYPGAHWEIARKIPDTGIGHFHESVPVGSRCRRGVRTRHSSVTLRHGRGDRRNSTMKPIDFVPTRDENVGMTSAPTISKITKHNGVAGQVSYSVDVTYPGEAPETIEFVGSVYGPPVVMVTPGNPRGVFVTQPERFGKFGPEWIRRFFS